MPFGYIGDFSYFQNSWYYDFIPDSNVGVQKGNAPVA